MLPYARHRPLKKYSGCFPKARSPTATDTNDNNALHVALAQMAASEGAGGVALVHHLPNMQGTELERIFFNPNNDGRSAAVLAAALETGSKRDLDAMRVIAGLLAARYDYANRADSDGITPYKAAVLTENTVFLEAFSERGTKPSPPGEDEPSLQEIARANGSWKALALLPDDKTNSGRLRAWRLARNQEGDAAAFARLGLLYRRNRWNFWARVTSSTDEDARRSALRDEDARRAYCRRFDVDVRRGRWLSIEYALEAGGQLVCLALPEVGTNERKSLRAVIGLCRRRTRVELQRFRRGQLSSRDNRSAFIWQRRMGW